MGDLSGRVALITGGAGAIGRALGDALGAAGTKVVLADLRGDGAHVHPLDVTDRDAFTALVDEVERQHGRLDVLVNNAGVAAAAEAHLLTAEDWDPSLDVNLRGAVNGVLAAYPRMVRRGEGHIVNVASLAGLVPVPLLVPYAAAKHGLVGLSASLRAEAARHGVGVTVVCPGPVETPLLDTGGVGGRTAGVDTRRYLTAAAGPALAPEVIAVKTVRAIERNRLYVVPGRARAVWALARLAPVASQRLLGLNVRRELRRNRG